MCGTAWGFFIVFEALIGYDKFANSHPLCPGNDLDYPTWYWYLNFGVLGAFIFVWISLIIKISQIKRAEEKTPHLVAINIVSMGTIATLLALLFDWGGVCIDVLGFDFYWYVVDHI